MSKDQRTVDSMAIATEAWREVPDWVRMLAERCNSLGQSKAAGRIGYSPSLVNQVLKNKYGGNLSRVQCCVERAFKTQTVTCPVLGEIGGSLCLKHQAAKPNTTNHMAVALYRACRRCPNACGGERG
jgi:hypothetical protein